MNDGSSKIAYIRDYLGQSCFDEILAYNICLTDCDDYCIRDLSNLGQLSMKSAWELITQRALITHLAKSCWHQNVPLKMYIFLWKQMHNVVLTEVAIKRKVIPISSKCLCCYSNFNIEFNNNLFISSNTAIKVCAFFSVMMS